MAEAVEEEEERWAVVLDVGTGLTKAGFAADDEPRAVFPTTIAESDEKKGSEPGKCPVEYGLVVDWDGMQQLWQHSFDVLKTKPQSQAVLLSDPPLNPKKNREKMIQIMFETFNVPKFYLSNQSTLSLYASGKTTGIVCDSGDSATHIVPIFEDYCQPHAVHRLDLAGRDLTEYLSRIMEEGAYFVSSPPDLETVRRMKESLGYVASDYEDALAEADESESWQKEFELPDGSVVTLGRERFQCAEPLFQPSLFGVESEGIHKLINDSVMKCDEDIRPQLFRNIVICGGSSMFDNLAERVKREVEQLAPESMAVEVAAQPERHQLCWIGGSIYGSLSMFNEIWIYRAEFDECGPSIVHRKCN